MRRVERGKTSEKGRERTEERRVRQMEEDRGKMSETGRERKDE